MKKKDSSKEILKMVHSGLRLNTPAPKRETPKTVYSRKTKHKRRFDTSSYFFITVGPSVRLQPVERFL